MLRMTDRPAGIPGSVGATPIQNVGAYGQEVAETISAVRVLDRADGAVPTLGPADCGFTYRSSAFKREPGRWVVLAVSFALEPEDAALAGPRSRCRRGALRRCHPALLQCRRQTIDDAACRLALGARREGEGHAVLEHRLGQGDDVVD